MLGWIIPAAGIGLALSADAAASEARHVGFSDLQSQRLEGQTAVIVKGAVGSQGLTVLVTVGVDGRVVDARAGRYNFGKVDPMPGLAEVRRWRFRPPRLDGKPVIAVGEVTIGYKPPEEMPDASIPFPDNPAGDIEITLERDSCLGPCPDYKVTVRGDGTVRFSTGDNGPARAGSEVGRSFNSHNVLLPGVHTAHVDPGSAGRLVRKFRDAHFFGLKSEYRASITDGPTYTLIVRAGERSKRVVDYIGGAVGMPAIVTELEDAVDAVAGSDRWIEGNPETIAWLQAEGFDFRSQTAAELVAAATEPFHYQYRGRRSEPMILALLDKGVPLDATVEPVAMRGVAGEELVREPKASLGSVLAYRSAEAGDEPLFRRMARAGYLARLPQDRLDQALGGGAGCNAAIARALVKAGANAASGNISGSALANLGWMSPACEGERRMAMARTLVDLGVPVDGRSESGWTPLMGCGSPGLARLLLARGADPNARDKEGTTPLLATRDDRVALILLAAGADPRAKNKQGSVREHAIEQHMPATLAWLDAHGIE